MDPEGLRFTESHEWVAMDGDEATVGITDHAQSELNDIIYVELPKVGDRLGKGDVLAVLESVKAAEEMYSPVSGEVMEVNSALEETPERINADPFGEGWIARLKVDEAKDVGKLLTHMAYRKMLEEA